MMDLCPLSVSPCLCPWFNFFMSSKNSFCYACLSIVVSRLYFLFLYDSFSKEFDQMLTTLTHVLCKIHFLRLKVKARSLYLMRIILPGLNLFHLRVISVQLCRNAKHKEDVLHIRTTCISAGQRSR